MKKILAMLLVLTMALTVLCACGDKKDGDTDSKADSKVEDVVSNDDAASEEESDVVESEEESSEEESAVVESEEVSADDESVDFEVSGDFEISGDIFEVVMPEDAVVDEDLVGVWVAEDESGTFAFNADGTAAMIVDGLTVDATWGTLDGTLYLNISMFGIETCMPMTYEFTAEGVEITNEGDTMLFVEGELAEVSEVVLEGEIDSALVGTWEGEAEGITMTYTFNEDGTGEAEVLGMTVDLTWVTNDGVLITVIMGETEEDEYTVDGDTLTLTGIEFTRA